MKAKNFLIRMADGFLIGLAGIVPGASGGVIAVSMGVYRPMLEAVYELLKLKRLRTNFLYLLPLAVGGLLGILSTSNALEFLLKNYRFALMYALIGMVLGGVPALLRDANSQGFKGRYLWGTAVGVLFVVALALMQSHVIMGRALEYNRWTSLAGGIMMVGVVIPGVSTSFVLMYLGLYEPLLRSFNTFDLSMLLWAALGAVAVGVLLLMFVRKMFSRYHGYAYYAVLGFLLGTVALIFPGVTQGWALALHLLLLAGGFAFSLLITKNADKKGETVQ